MDTDDGKKYYTGIQTERNVMYVRQQKSKLIPRITCFYFMTTKSFFYSPVFHIEMSTSYYLFLLHYSGITDCIIINAQEGLIHFIWKINFIPMTSIHRTGGISIMLLQQEQTILPQNVTGLHLFTSKSFCTGSWQSWLVNYFSNNGR